MNELTGWLSFVGLLVVTAALGVAVMTESNPFQHTDSSDFAAIEDVPQRMTECFQFIGEHAANVDEDVVRDPAFIQSLKKMLERGESIGGQDGREFAEVSETWTVN